MIKIVLVGANGKMGKVISQIALENNMQIVAGIDKTENICSTYPIYANFDEIKENFDAVIDFSHPSLLDATCNFCLKNKKPLVMATTGLNENHKQKLSELSKIIPVFVSSNYSYGIYILNKLVKQATKLLNDWDVEIIEKHHNQKIDAPGGTSFMIANSIKEEKANANFVIGRNEQSEKRKSDDVGIHAVRGGTVVGEHEVMFFGDSETISITHNAQSKNIFAVGAFKACKFLINQKNGLFSMEDL